MDKLTKRNEDILKILCFTNIIYLIGSIFYISKVTVISLEIINIIFLGSFFVIKKYGVYFELLSKTNKMAKVLNNHLTKFN